MHLLGLVLGLGAATALDLLLMRRLRDPVTEEFNRTVGILAGAVAIGLLLLWLSGAGFLLHYAAFDPGKLENPKIWAKVTIVLALTLNGVFIHKSVLPDLGRRVGQSLFDGLSPTRRRLFVASAAISLVSWYMPMLLGAVPQFNRVVPAEVILAAYLLVVLTSMAIGLAVLPRRGEIEPGRALPAR